MSVQDLEDVKDVKYVVNYDFSDLAEDDGEAAKDGEAETEPKPLIKVVVKRVKITLEEYEAKKAEAEAKRKAEEEAKKLPPPKSWSDCATRSLTDKQREANKGVAAGSVASTTASILDNLRFLSEMKKNGGLEAMRAAGGHA